MAIQSAAGRSSAATDEFLRALADGLSRTCLWQWPVVVGVSGGADSVALLLGLERLAPAAARPRLLVAHAEHDLRAAAAADREFVAQLAAALHLRFTSRLLAVRHDPDARGEGLEARARRLRYEFLLAAAHEAGARHVVVAHTADDQAETILHRSLRGTGLAGLVGMPAARELGDGVALARPMLSLPRSLPRRFLREIGQPWREDESNADTRLARNFLRHAVLAPCARGPYPAATESLLRIGRQADAFAAALRSAAAHLLDVHATRGADGTVTLAAERLAGLDRHLLAEAFAVLWVREGWPRRDMAERHFTSLAAAVCSAGREQRSGYRVDLPGDVSAVVDGRRLVLRPRG